ncbi:MAG: hypothetical protein P1U87_00160 [Verrucomicrobiales bacterium]|nr:hypothetical protein [Verrucomicrobiales bacterium]
MLTDEQKQKLTTLAGELINQEAARVLVEPQDRSTGYWFGGGNVIQDRDGSILICGRYRNYGDSRTGVGAGERGLELAIFRAPDVNSEFEKIVSFTKADLAHSGMPIVSIEGVALHLTLDGIELFISTEKDAKYPERLADFQKPGAGVWSIDRIHANRVEDLSSSNIEEIIPFGSDDPARLHCKDPWVFDLENGDLVLGYCTHPFTWSSSGTALFLRKAGSASYEKITDDLLRRGPVWDIAAARVTERLAVPNLGAFSNEAGLSLYFYDSCECLRQLDENPTAVSRPRGWSCEEIGGIAVGKDRDLTSIESLSIEGPAFVSPTGTGCSRYIATLVTDAGIFANWQQSQPDLSQPLVGHFLPMDRVIEILS